MHQTSAPQTRASLPRGLARYGYAPTMLLGVNGTAITLAGSGAPRCTELLVLGFAIGLSYVVERLLPYEPTWNLDQDDTWRDRIHATVNESLILVSVLAIPLVASVNPIDSRWPDALPFWVQALLAVLVADLGITTVHLASHKVGVLWRFHAVHHSVTRFYGLNGLMKHPLHQTIEMTAGVVPLILLGLPVEVASALAVMVAVQLLLQHSNADYRVGALRHVLALNEGHRFHHLKWAGVGDVNFGLFTLLWDHLFGTFSFDPNRRFDSSQLGMAAKPDYPVGYARQLTYPFTPSGGCEPAG